MGSAWITLAAVCIAIASRVAQAGVLSPGVLRAPLRLRGGVAALVEKTNNTLSPEASRLIKEHNDTSVDVCSVYQMGKVLGEGGFAKVCKGKHRITGKEVAIKSINLRKIKSDKLDMLKNEIEVMKMLDHPNIVRLYETFHDEQNHVMHLVMELCEGGDLLEFLLKINFQENGTKIWSNVESGGSTTLCFTEHLVSQFASKMFSAVQYLHSLDIVHRDLKPENFMLEARAEDLDGSPFEGGETKMIDFGFSKKFNGLEDEHQVGTSSLA